MLKALAVTFVIFAILFSGIIALKRTANQFKLPKGVKPQPYEDDERESDEPQPLKQEPESQRDTDNH